MKKILIVTLIVVGFQMCNFNKDDKSTIELNQNIDIILSEYIDTLEIEKVDISYSGPYSKMIDSMKLVHVTLFNPPKKSDLYSENLSLKIACDVYDHLKNKNAFKGICINYLYEDQGTYISGQYYNNRHQFSYQEIRNFQDTQY